MKFHTQLRNSLSNREKKSKKKTPFNTRNYNNKRNERNGRKPNMCFICGSEDHFIANGPKPYTSHKKLHWNTDKPKTCVCISAKIDKTL